MTNRGPAISLRGSRPEPVVATIQPGECAHHWRIDTPNGAYSDGVCRKCGVTKEFKNSSDYMGKFDDGFVL